MVELACLTCKWSVMLMSHAAEERGRWWVVGSAWQGAGPGAANPATQKSQLAGQNYSEKLLELARKQRMNTDVRRNIFCILMTAEVSYDLFLGSDIGCQNQLLLRTKPVCGNSCRAPGVMSSVMSSVMSMTV
jgi:hypothetical protein